MAQTAAHTDRHTQREDEALRRNGGRVINRSPALARHREVIQQSRRSSIADWTTSMDAPPAQVDAFDNAIGDLHDAVALGNHSVWGDPLPARLQSAPVQMHRSAAAPVQMRRQRDADTDIHSAAEDGLRGNGGALPFAAQIQQSFGRHDVSSVSAHLDGAAKKANASMGSLAYASGNAIAFGARPDLHTAAHEAAHIVQQRAGVQLAGGVGQSGDRYERHADAVAARVVQGQSAEDLLDAYAPTSHSAAPVQRRVVQHHGRTSGGEADRAAQANGTAPYYGPPRPGSSASGAGPNRSAPTTGGTASASGAGPESTAAAERDGQPARARHASPVQVTRNLVVRGMDAFRGAIGEVIALALGSSVGSSVNANITARITIEGAVMTVEVEVSAERKTDSTADMAAFYGIGLGLGDHNNSVSLIQRTRSAATGVATTPNGLGTSVSSMMHNSLLHAGESPVPNPLMELIYAALGPVGVAVRGIEFARQWWGTTHGNGQPSNATMRWLTGRIWGPGFRREACQAMGSNAAVESEIGARVEGRGRIEADTGGLSATGPTNTHSGNVQGGAAEARIEACDAQARPLEPRQEIRTQVEINWAVGDADARMILKFSPAFEFRVRARYRWEASGGGAEVAAFVHAIAPRVIALVRRADAEANGRRPAGAAPHAPVTDAQIAAGVEEAATRTFTAATLSMIPGARFGVAVEFSYTQRASKLKLTWTQANRQRPSVPSDLGVGGSVEAAVESGHGCEVTL